ncbi:RHS repeat-associated core domain-containing protein [Chryseobacterium gossypii]|uniref:RHS repeat-associated core domain-containing protein n=1 Tax=Chryseobacterium gossypii TaxID=3231602 RepID=UPI003524662D
MKFYNNKRKSFLSFVLLLISMVGFAQTTPVQYFHDTKGNIDVNGAGQLQFSLPIALPPGIKSVAPQVNLVYTSGSSNGVVGYGWNISGITSISRAGKNIEKDGEMRGVQLDYSDFYNFNGQRLVLKSGVYGKDGAEYVTEKFSNTKIKSIGAVTGQAWQGPEYWEVTFADGSQAWYGATSSGDSNARTPLEYNIVKWKDSQGNYITYNYLQDTGTNVAVISSINWGGNETLGKPHYNEIGFTYNATSTRGLIEQSYVNGISLIQDKLLNNIIVRTNNSQYRKYEVIYQSDNTKYQFVQKIQEYNADNQPANPIEFFRQENLSNSGYVSNGSWKNFYDLKLSGDFRGTHITDFIVDKSPTIGPDGYYLLLGNGFDSPAYYLGTENVYQGAIPINIKDANNTVSSRQGFVSYSINPTTKDLTFKYYLIDLSQPIDYSSGLSIMYPNALSLVGTKVIAGNQWDESESNFSNPFSTYNKTTTIKKLISYDIDGDGVSEILIEKNNNITNRVCTVSGNQFPTEDDWQTSTYDESKYFVIKQQDNSFPFFQFYVDKSENLLFGDFNGDGVEDIGKSSSTVSAIINGESVPGNILKAYNLKKDAQGNLSLYEVFSADYSGLSSQAQIGDFNGDGLSDLFVRTNVNNHYIVNLNTGINFVKTPYFNDFNSTENYTSSQNGTYSTAKVLDINEDGKSDIINFSSSYNIASPTSASSSFSIRVSESQGYLNGRIQFVSNQTVTDNYSYPVIFRDILGLRQNQLYIYRSSNQTEGSINNYGHYSNLQRPINRIIQGGNTTSIFYGSTNNSAIYYKPVKSEQYPLMELENVNSEFVSSIYESGSQPNSNRFKEFRYRGLIINLHNKKTIGFRQMASSSWNSKVYPANNLLRTNLWSGTETDPLNEGAPVKEWSIRTNDESKIFPADISENNTQLLSFKSTTYQTDKLLNGQVVTTVPDADKPKIVTVILPKTTKEKDFLTGAIAESTITYGQYYLPVQNVSKINTNYAVTSKIYDYYNNPSGTGSDYYIGRVKSKTETVQAYGDTKSGKEEFSYDSNLLKTIKKWNRDNTAYILNTFNYDGFGNVTQKVTSNNIDSGTETTASLYDADGRFVVKTTDNLGLESSFNYNIWGQVLTQTDPLGNTITNTYDHWGKLLSSTSNLEGATTYTYERDSNSNITVTKYSPDGDVSKSITNKLGQEYKVTTKAFGQGQFVSKETEFDVLGRKIKESEPYFEGQSPSQWNTIVYDDSVFPAKVTATAFNGKQTETAVSGLTTTVKEINGNVRTYTKTVDALGNTISTTDKGGTITYSYNAAGEQIQAKYEQNTVSTGYDSWGRKSQFNDPSNGLYKYEYNGLGQPTKIISPKGTKQYTYNNLGQLISQTELSSDGISTNKTMAFTYDTKGRLTAKSGTSNGKAYSSTLEFDTYGRIKTKTENSNGKIYAEKGFFYDAQSRVSSYTKSLTSSGIITEVTIMHKYNDWNGELYQLRDKKTGMVLWELQRANAKGQALTSKLGAVSINNTYDNNGFFTNINHSSVVKPDILKISYSFDALKNELKYRKTEGDFYIEENFDYDDNNRLVNWTDPVTGVKPSSNRNTYDVKGRIMENDQVGTMKYENSAKIYQPTGMILNAAGTQNYNNDLIQTIAYNENNDPIFIDGLKGDVNFEYGLTSMRQRASYGGNFASDKYGKFTKLYSEDGSFEVTIDNTTKLEKHMLYIGGTPYESNIIYLKNYKDTSGSYKFLHKDYLGSILAITDEKGKKLEQRHFDAWGNLTHLQLNTGSIITEKPALEKMIAKYGLITDRGYTSHEHFFEVGIVHMNGRLYDPLLRRFLNADENIQDPANTQNYNKYGYVMNNPMMYNDPSGEFIAWLIGALVGSYLNGVQANNGNWNPVKWDWKHTWTAVLGGGIAGAAIGGAIQNISANGTKMIQNSVVGAVGSIFNGIANGQNIFKSALIGFSGINYSFNLSGNSVTSTDISDSPYGGYKTNSEDYGFVSASYAINDEEPVSFFGKNDDNVFHEKFNEMYNLFKNTKGDGIFRVYSHGNFEMLFNGEERIKSAKSFDAVMNSKNSNWKNVDKMKDPILILFACLSGTDNRGQKNSMGLQISKAHPNVTVFAFNGFVTYDTSVGGIQNSNLRQGSGDGNGIIKVYYGGKAIVAYEYREFLKHYPAFK